MGPPHSEKMEGFLGESFLGLLEVGPVLAVFDWDVFR